MGRSVPRLAQNRTAATGSGLCRCRTGQGHPIWLNRDPLGDIAGLPLLTESAAPWETDDVVVGLTEAELQEAWLRVIGNLYGAMGNNPVNLIDPFALADCPAGLGPGSLNPENLTALDIRTASEIAKAAAERAKQQMAKAVQTMVKQAAKDGPKSLERSMRSFDKQVAKHLKKIADNPNSPAANHWKNEIENWQRLKQAAEKVLRACPKE